MILIVMQAWPCKVFAPAREGCDSWEMQPSRAQGLARGLVWISALTCTLVQVLSYTVVCGGLNRCS